MTDLAEKLYLSGKTLERKFTSLVGKTPKQYARIVRFMEVIKGFTSMDRKQLTTLAYEHGYFDQAHFVKDFKTLSGYTPSDFLSRYPCHGDIPPTDVP